MHFPVKDNRGYKCASHTHTRNFYQCFGQADLGNDVHFLKQYTAFSEFPLEELAYTRLLLIDDQGYGLFFGRLSYEKGVDHLLEAIEKLPGVPFKIAGTGPSEKQLHELTREKGLDNVEFLGFVTGDALIDLISKASFTVIPSIWYENCPMSVLESLSLRTPVLGADIGGIPELVDHGVDGLVYPAGDSEALASTISEMMESAERRAQMGEVGRSKIIRDFNEEVHYQKLLEIYKEVSC